MNSTPLRRVVHLVAGARPNIMKVAPVFHALSRTDWCTPVLVHTGQHYDPGLSDSLWSDLRLPSADVRLAVGSGSHAEQTAAVMTRYEPVLIERRPDWVVVVGDVNSTLAATLAAAKLGIPVAHLEAGLRSWNRAMPEEVNRIVTDALADLLWTPSEDADRNLLREGVAPERIERVGNVMIDSYELLKDAIERAGSAERAGVAGRDYAVVTLHRPANVDDPARLALLAGALRRIATRIPLVFAVHPRTLERLRAGGLWEDLEAAPGIVLTPPLGYIDFMSLVAGCRLVVTDSGGIQEETTYLGIPCLTLRQETERPVTVEQGTNELVAAEDLERSVELVLAGGWKRGMRPELWDGRTAERVAESLARHSGAG